MSEISCQTCRSACCIRVRVVCGSLSEEWWLPWPGKPTKPGYSEPYTIEPVVSSAVWSEEVCKRASSAKLLIVSHHIAYAI